MLRRRSSSRRRTARCRWRRPCVAGAWLGDGPAEDGSVRTVGRRSVAPASAGTDRRRCGRGEYARGGPRRIARLAPAARAEILDAPSQLATSAARRVRPADRPGARQAAQGRPGRDGPRRRHVRGLRRRGPPDRRRGAARWPAGARGIGNTALTYRAPAGVALAITPFNAPANLLAHKLGASFAAGNTTIVKAPPQAPAVSAGVVVALLLEAGAPVEAVQLLHGGGDVGAALCAAPEVAVISFTGSAATGAAVARAAGAKRLVLELGGNAATIVCEDADIAAAAEVCARTGYTNSGQSCISVQRVYVQRSRYDEFLDAFTAEVGQARRWATRSTRPPTSGPWWTMTPPSGSSPGPPRRPAAGASITIGGTRDGATVVPTVVADPPADAAVVTEEVFGALVSVLPYDDFDDVVAECNESRYGLQAGLFTRDIGRIITAWRELEVGGLIVNGSSNFRLDHVPFGGVKDSGFGRESPRLMIDDFTVVKTLLRARHVDLGGGRMTIVEPTGAAAIAAQLKAYGVEYVFGTCGHTNIALLDALQRGRHRLRHRPPRAGRGARRRRVRPGHGRARRAAGPRGPRPDERGHRRRDRGAGLGAAGRHRRRHPVLLVRSAPAPGGQPARRRRPDRDLPAVRQAGLARAPGRGPAPVHRARLLDRHLRTAGRGAAQRADGPVLPTAAGLDAAIGHPLPASAHGAGPRGRPPRPGSRDALLGARAPADLPRRRAAAAPPAGRAASSWPSTWTSRSSTR